MGIKPELRSTVVFIIFRNLPESPIYSQKANLFQNETGINNVEIVSNLKHRANLIRLIYLPLCISSMLTHMRPVMDVVAARLMRFRMTIRIQVIISHFIAFIRT